ncbi:hypothetical protein BV25DRAFT_1993669 [Artomyces pyxidatus]|uniref:Uncharacterized protein n=1 Tax=Artomyces pyxidatus TaxID=48021 RepID=A0ACB8SU29_9AGAM|nr:hypothetical protein BV25DRAFT_1993669 [Artomyces pyxidatus]
MPYSAIGRVSAQENASNLTLATPTRASVTSPSPDVHAAETTQKSLELPTWTPLPPQPDESDSEEEVGSSVVRARKRKRGDVAERTPRQSAEELGRPGIPGHSSRVSYASALTANLVASLDAIADSTTTTHPTIRTEVPPSPVSHALSESRSDSMILVSATPPKRSSPSASIPSPSTSVRPPPSNVTSPSVSSHRHSLKGLSPGGPAASLRPYFDDISSSRGLASSSRAAHAIQGRASPQSTSPKGTRKRLSSLERPSLDHVKLARDQSNGAKRPKISSAGGTVGSAGLVDLFSRIRQLEPTSNGTMRVVPRARRKGLFVPGTMNKKVLERAAPAKDASPVEMSPDPLAMDQDDLAQVAPVTPRRAGSLSVRSTMRGRAPVQNAVASTSAPGLASSTRAADAPRQPRPNRVSVVIVSPSRASTSARPRVPSKERPDDEREPATERPPVLKAATSSATSVDDASSLTSVLRETFAQNAELPEFSLAAAERESRAPERSRRRLTRVMPTLSPRAARETVAVVKETKTREQEVSEQEMDALLDTQQVELVFESGRARPGAGGKGSPSKAEEGQERPAAHRWVQREVQERARMDLLKILSGMSGARTDGAHAAVQGPKPGEIRASTSGAQMWIDRLEAAFGPGPADRGMGKKPRRLKTRPQNIWDNEAVNGDDASQDAGPANLGDRIVESTEDGVTEWLHASDPDRNADLVTEEQAIAWGNALMRLVKGKAALDEGDMSQLSATLRDVERTHTAANAEVLKTSSLVKAVRSLGALEELPLGDRHQMIMRASAVASFWDEKFGSHVLDG